MQEEERREFLVWYDSQRPETFDNRHVLDSYFQEDVTVLRQACRAFRREFMQIGHIDVFVEAITIASACKKVLRKRFLQPDTIGLIPTGECTCNNRYSKKALMWLLHMERRTVATGVKTGSWNYPTSAWTVTAPRLIQFTSSLAVFGTDTLPAIARYCHL